MDDPLVHEVQEPPGRRDEDVDSPLERLLLRPLPDAAEDDRVPEREVPAVGPKAVADLRRELARRRDHEDPDGPPAPGVVGGLLERQPLEDRQRERRRLAGAGLGDPEQVAAGQHDGDGLRLDGRRLGVALLADGLKERVDEI